MTKFSDLQINDKFQLNGRIYQKIDDHKATCIEILYGQTKLSYSTMKNGRNIVGRNYIFTGEKLVFKIA